MPYISVPRVLIGGTFSGVGKSILTLGLTVALRKLGMSVSCCVTGLDVHQGILFQRMCRRYARVLDPRFLGPEMIRFSLYQAALGADLVLIDGRGGLFDGPLDDSSAGADAVIAKVTGSPVILVGELEEFSNSAAALISGYSSFNGGGNIDGVIINRFGLDGTEHDSRDVQVAALNKFLQRNGQPPCIGVVPTATLSESPPPRGLSQETNVTSFSAQFYHDLGDLVSKYVDVDAVLAIARKAQELELPVHTEPPLNRRCRIAVAEDGCFSCSIPDNIDLLRYFGAELVPFSPIADTELPERVAGLYLGGAYLSSYGEELSMNYQMRGSIRDFVSAGGLLFSEGAGTAYLCKRFEACRGEDLFDGVGVLPFDAVLSRRDEGLITVKTFDESILGASCEVLRGVATNEYVGRGVEATQGRGLMMVAEVAPLVENNSAQHSTINVEGFSITAQSFSTFHFLHLGATPLVAKSIVEAAALTPLNQE